MFIKLMIDTILFLHQVNSKMVYKSFKATMDTNFVQANLSVGYVGDVSTISAYIDVFRTLNSKFFVYLQDTYV
jgi:3-hydroxy-3-methylglutaryl CoA synthase